MGSTMRISNREQGTPRTVCKARFELRVSRRHQIILALFLSTVLAGCSHLPLSEKFASIWQDDNDPVAPERVTAMWSDTIMSQRGQEDIRGFGGRLMFYARGREKPVKVDGVLTVYAFDDTDNGPMQSTP